MDIIICVSCQCLLDHRTRLPVTSAQDPSPKIKIKIKNKRNYTHTQREEEEKKNWSDFTLELQEVEPYSIHLFK